MRNLAMSVVRGRRDTAAVCVVPEPEPDEGAVLVRTLLVGVCGTDLHLAGAAAGRVGSVADTHRLILGHEAVGQVLEAPGDSGFTPGGLVTGIVRHPCAECAACERGEWDFCTSGHYTERGIRGADGFGRQRWRSEPEYLVPVPDELGELGVLVEPMSVVCKAVETAYYVARRAPTTPGRLLVTGAGPIGLLAAAAGVDAGLDVTVLDRMSTGVKPSLVTALGGTYTNDLGPFADGPRFDLAFECSGAGEVLGPATALLGQAGVMMLIAGANVEAGSTPRMLVRANAALVGTVNAGRRHYDQAVSTLLRLDREWLGRLITRRVPLDRWADALHRDEHEVKSVVEFESAAAGSS